MPLTSAQIVSLSVQSARVPGMTSQAGQTLNAILSDLCQTYDFAKALNTTTVVLTSQVGSGPYPLPADYLRLAIDEAVYQVDGVPYVMVNIDLAEFDAAVQVAGLQNYPVNFTTDPSQTPPVMYVWPPPTGVFNVQIRYYRQMADITTPETSATVPWFPHQNYLIKRLSGELMQQIANDDRYKDFLGSSEDGTGAAGILREYLRLQDDDEGRAKTVKLDRRRFGRNFGRLPATKLIGF